MKLSVVIPIYNAEKYLEHNLKTLVNQLQLDTELILVNDGSSDNSLSICEQFSKEKTNIIVVTQENSGVSAARNTGIKHSKGDYITFVDSDDYVENTYIENILNLIQNNTDLVFFNSYYIVNGEKTIMKPWLTSVPVSKNIEYAIELLLSCKSNEPWDKIFKTSIIKDYNISFPDKVSLGEDLIFTLDYLKNIDSFSLTDEAIYNHVENPNGLGKPNLSNKVILDNIALFNSIEAFIIDKAVSERNVLCGCKMILQIMVKLIARLNKAGYSDSEINELLVSHVNCEWILEQTYTDIVSVIRKNLLKHHQYFLIGYMFGR